MADYNGPMPRKRKSSSDDRARAPREPAAGPAVRPGSLSARPLCPDPAQPLPAVFVQTATTHPLLYRKRIARVDKSARPGDLVAVYHEDGRLLGYGLYNPRSEIAVRMVRHDPELPDLAFWRRAAGPGGPAAARPAAAGRGDRRLPRAARRGGRIFRPGGRQVRRHALGRSLQPGHVSTGGRDPGGTGAAVRHPAHADQAVAQDAVPGRLRRRLAGLRRLAPASDDHGVRHAVPRPVRRGAQDGVLLRSTREPPDAGLVLPRPHRARSLLLHRRVRRAGDAPGGRGGGHRRRSG